MGVRMPPPQGGFYLFPNFEKHRSAFAKRGVANSTDLCEQLLDEAGVALLPGVAFGRPASELTARLSSVGFDGQKMLRAAVEMAGTPLGEAFLKKYAPNIIGAVAAIKEWLA